MTADRPQFPLRDYFAGVAEYTFETRLGIADPPLVDYITDLLTRFIRSDSLVRGARSGRPPLGTNRRHAGRRPTPAWATPAARCTATSATSPCSGPASIPKRCAARNTKVGHDRFVDYCTQGKRAYYIASTIPSESEDVRGEVLERLSQEFELCAFGLNEARKEWERRDPGGTWQLVVFN